MLQMSYQIFDSYDANQTGFLEPDEFRKVAKEVFCEINKNHPCSEEKFNKQFTTYDTNSDKKLSR